MAEGVYKSFTGPCPSEEAYYVALLEVKSNCLSEDCIFSIFTEEARFKELYSVLDLTNVRANGVVLKDISAPGVYCVETVEAKDALSGKAPVAKRITQAKLMLPFPKQWYP